MRSTLGAARNFVGQVNVSESPGTLDADLAAAIATAGSHPAHFAVAANFTGGDFSGHTYIVVDTNGNRAYDTGTDLVVEITGSNKFNINPVTAGDFI